MMVVQMVVVMAVMVVIEVVVVIASYDIMTSSTLQYML